MFLLALCDQARQALNHKWKPLRYEDEEALRVGSKKGGVGDNDDGIIEDEVRARSLVTTVEGITSIYIRPCIQNNHSQPQ
jgi:hypothetical protein